MNQKANIVGDAAQEFEGRQISLLELMIVVAKRKKLIIGFPLAVAVVVAAISFILPNVYKGTTKLLPPQQAQSGAAALLSQLGGIAGAASGVAGIKNPADLYIGMLKSRTIADKLIQKFELKKVYDTKSQEAARRKLEENTGISTGKDGMITIEVEGQNKALVAPLANAYVQELLQLTKVIAVTEASQRRLFFERQLELAKNNLAASEMAMKVALDNRGVISVDAESRAVVETVGRLRAHISAKEIELNSMRSFVTTNNPNFQRVEQELSSMRMELSRLENGRNEGRAASPERDTPHTGLGNIKILRDVKYYQMLYELLAKQYEAARLDEAKDSSLIQVLDPALEPERKFKPKRTLLVLTSFVLALILALIWAFLTEARDQAIRSPAGAARWHELHSLLRLRRGTRKINGA